MKDDKIKESDKMEAKQWLICLLYIFKGCCSSGVVVIFSDVDLDIISQWWKKESATRVKSLFAILLIALDLAWFHCKLQ